MLVRLGIGLLLIGGASAPSVARAAPRATPVESRVVDSLESRPPIPCAKDEGEVGLSRRALGTAASVAPGILVHGTGHWTIGKPCTARRLALAEGIGAGAFLSGGTTIVLTGASRYLVFPAISLTIGGFGLFATSFLADIYGVTGASRVAGHPLTVAPRFESEVGALYVENPVLGEQWLVTQRASVNHRSLRLTGALHTGTDAKHARYQLGGSLRVFGPRPQQRAPDGSFLDWSLGVASHRQIALGFVTNTVETSITGRLDLVRIGPSLRGSFAELAFGGAFTRTQYAVDGKRVPRDIDSLLLGRVVFGMYLGSGVRRGGELAVYYDHRHDGYAAGLKVPGLGSGNLGHFGLTARHYLSANWGIGGTTEVGSAYVAQLTVNFRSGGER